MHFCHMPLILSSPAGREPSCGRFDSLGESFKWNEPVLETLNFIYTVTGTGLVETATEQLVFKEGNLLFFRPHTARSYTALKNTPWVFYWVHLNLDWMQTMKLRSPILKRKWVSARVANFVEPLLSELLNSSLQNRHQKEAEHYAAELLTPILAAAHRHTNLKNATPLDPRIMRALEIINYNFLSPLDVPTLAQKTGLSRQRFTTLFSTQIGQSPAAYIEQRRLEYARRLLLTTNFSVAEIADRTGYECPFHFSRRFKQIFKSPPSTLRNHL